MIARFSAIRPRPLAACLTAVAITITTAGAASGVAKTSVRDVLGAPSASEAERQLEHCEARFDDYSERVVTAMSQTT